MIDLDLVIEGANHVPALPESARRLASLLSDPDWELEDVTRTVKRDPVLSGRVLRHANSAASGARRTIGDLDQAVLRVGPGVTLGFALGAAARAELDVVLPAYGLPSGRLWRHAVAASMAVERLRTITRRNPPPEAFSAALLHDVGILVLSRQLDAEVLEYLRRAWVEGDRSLVEAELELLGVHHGEVGGLIARQWGLPEVIAEAITFHHTPEQAPSAEGRHLADLVALGDGVAFAVGEGAGEPLRLDGALDAPLLQRLGLEEAAYAELAAGVGQDLAAVLAIYE